MVSDMLGRLDTAEVPFNKGTSQQLKLYQLLAAGYVLAIFTCGLADFVYIKKVAAMSTTFAPPPLPPRK